MRWKFKWIFLSIILIFVGLFFLDSALNTDKRLLRGMLNISEIPAFKILECDHHGNFMDTDNVCYLVLENSDRFGLLLAGREFISRSADKPCALLTEKMKEKLQGAVFEKTYFAYLEENHDENALVRSHIAMCMDKERKHILVTHYSP